MPLTLTLQTSTSIPLEVDSIRNDLVRGQSADDVLRTLIQRGNKQVPLGEFFDATGSAADDAEVVWEGDCSKVKYIGAHLASGRIRVEGDAGMHLGAEMTGGEIVVNGNAHDWLGAEMKGGRILVHGNTGHLVGATYRGGRRGMSGGEVLIDGNAGNEIGHSMRRGLIAVGGNAGDFAGVAMIAGTILIGGEAGIRNGAGMKRGTIALLGPASDSIELLPTFRYASTYRPTFLTLYLRHLADSGFAVPDGAAGSEYLRYCGDFLELGKGEILVRDAA